jgi:hypothetical protein
MTIEFGRAPASATCHTGATGSLFAAARQAPWRARRRFRKKVGITAASNFRLELITAGRVDISFPSAHAALEEWAMLIDSKRVRPANEMALVGMKRGLSQADLNALRRGIDPELQTLYSDVLREEIPDRIAELLSQLCRQLRQLDQKDST